MSDKVQAVSNVVNAIEAFTDAKITCDRRYAAGYTSGYLAAARRDVDETREHLFEKLAELVQSCCTT